MSVDTKAALLNLARQIWDSPDFRFSDSERSRALREDILRQLLALAMTDDERAALLGLPAGCRIRESAKIIAPRSLECGEHVWIGENAVVDASGGMCIGSHTTISVGALLWSHESVMSNLMMDNRSGNHWIVRRRTEIGSGCYIGGPCSIYPGVRIGDGVVVLPMSVVTEDLPDGVMAGGSPARVIRRIDEDWRRRYREANGLREES